MADELTLRPQADPASAGVVATEAPLTVGEFVSRMSAIFPEADGESWDNYGLCVGDPSAEITKIAVALDATVSNIRRAKAMGANLLLTHHPAYLEAPLHAMPLEADPFASGVVWEAASTGVAVVSFHTACDASVAAGQILPDMLNLESLEVFKPLASNPAKGYGRLCTCKPDDSLTLGTLAARCTSVFCRQPRVWGNPDFAPSKILTWGGSLGHSMEPFDFPRVDCVICGEVGYHTALALAEAGIAVIELGHDVSELPLTKLLHRTAIQCGVESDNVVLLDRGAHWWTPEPIRA